MILQSTENILQVWLYFTCKQTHENEKIFCRNYFTSKQMERLKSSHPNFWCIYIIIKKSFTLITFSVTSICKFFQIEIDTNFRGFQSHNISHEDVKKLVSCNPKF